MYESQLLKIKIRPGKTDQVIEFLRTLQERKSQCLDAMAREGMVVENMFLERRDKADYLYYYVKAKDLKHANEINMQATDSLTLEIRRFVAETWDHIVSPEPLLDWDLIREDVIGLHGLSKVEDSLKPMRARRKAKSTSANVTLPHAIAG